jgi:hypothetical protein
MHKQHPQTAYRKYAVSIGTIFENCDKRYFSNFSINKAPHPAVYRGKAGRFAFLLTEREESGMILVSPKKRRPAWEMRSRRSPWQTDMTNSREPYRQKGSL